jgi:type II secretory pathway pseudopilin PulG
MPVYVQHEVLGKINDVFNADALWQAPGMSLFARQPLLRDLLERSPREQRGRDATRCFAHVTLMLPQEDVDDDRHLTRGARVRDLADSLAALHQKDFGDLLKGDEVRYDVVGGAALGPGQVQVKFGHAVYLPAPAEKPLYLVTASTDSAIWKAVCPVYPNQRLALLGPDADGASHAVADWPFGPDAAILLINDGPDGPLEVQVRPKDGYESQFDPLNGYYTIKAKGAAASGPRRLLLKVTRTVARAQAVLPAAESAKSAGVWQTRGPVPAEQTALPLARTGRAPKSDEATYAPSAQQRVSLAALALPRLSRYRDTGAATLEVRLDRQLAITALDAAITFAIDADDALHAITPAGRQRITVPASFTPVDTRVVRLEPVAPAMADRYCALLHLPSAPAVPLTGGARLVFGRGAPMLASLRVLDGSGALRSGSDVIDNADRLGLSRKAFSFEAVDGGYHVTRLAPTQALFHLDAQCGFVASINDDQPYLLPPGHHLVAGHYVLRFDA